MQRAPLTPLARVLHGEGRKQAWLAERLGVADVQVWRWVHGLHEPADETKALIAEALGRTVGELFPAHGAEVSALPTVPLTGRGDDLPEAA